MKNKLFIVLPLLLVGLVGCGGKGGGDKNRTTPIDFYKFHQLALKADEKDNPNRYATAFGYAYDYDEEEEFEFALEEKFTLNDEGNLVKTSAIYPCTFILPLINQKALDVEDDDACVYYKYADGRIGYYMEWYDGREYYEFNKYGRIINCFTERITPEIHDDRRVLEIPPMDADMDLTVTWSKKEVESKSYFLGFDAKDGTMANGRSAMILEFPKNTTETFINVLRNVQPFSLGEQGSWLARCFGVHDEYQVINQSLVYDAEYVANYRFGYFYFIEETTEMTVEITVQVGYEACIQVQFGEGYYQETVYPTENDYTVRVTLKYGKFIEPRAKRELHVLRIYGEIYSVAFANQTGLFNRQNSGLLAAVYDFTVTRVAQVPSYAFNGCNVLEAVEWPSDEASLIYVASYAFYNCGQYMWQLYLYKNLSLDDYALSGCSAVVIWDLDKIPNNTEEPGYDGWHTKPDNWSDTFDTGFEGHTAYYAWDDFDCEIGGDNEYIFAIYWTDVMDSIQVSSQDLANKTAVTVYDDQFNELQNLIVAEEGASRTATFSYQEFQWIYISVTHTTSDIIDVFFTFMTH